MTVRGNASAADTVSYREENDPRGKKHSDYPQFQSGRRCIKNHHLSGLDGRRHCGAEFYHSRLYFWRLSCSCTCFSVFQSFFVFHQTNLSGQVDYRHQTFRKSGRSLLTSVIFILKITVCPFIHLGIPTNCLSSHKMCHTGHNSYVNESVQGRNVANKPASVGPRVSTETI